MIWKTGSPNHASRKTMYNVIGIPHAQFSGIDSYIGGSGEDMYPSYLPKYNALIDIDSPLTIDLQFKAYGSDQLILEADVELTSDITSSNNKIVYILTHEKEGNYFAVVVDYAEEDFNLTTAGQTATFKHNFAFDPLWDISKMKAIALVQTFSENYMIHQGAIASFISSNVQTGPACLDVQFSCNSLSQAGIESWEWDFNGDGVFDSTEENPSYLYEVPGTYDVTLKLFNGTEYIEITMADYITVVSPGEAFSGEVSGIWKAESNPYVIGGDVVLLENDKLIIEPGVEIRMARYSEFKVHGSLIADASRAEENPIVFSTANDWKGFKVISGAKEVRINNCEISKCTNSAIDIENSSNVEIIGNRFSYNESGTISLSSSDNILISRNVIRDNNNPDGVGGIFCTNSSPTISNNLIFNNRGKYGSFQLENNSNPTIINNTSVDNYGLDCEIFVSNSS
ncbi:MAG: right-handed parallel beta-helix repeat-containing protein, partial [Candidatus Cloacimonetes bacterium]|nr:right-handed parallel beta-helix repeat-containing protein [Candidatus Cloacimonadota bacterium]